MKTTLDGVVFLLPHVSSHAKTEFHRRRIFPGPREEGRNSMRHPGESCRTRTVGRQDEAAERGSKMDGRTGRQNGAQNKAAEQGGKTDRQDETAGRSGKTEQQDGAARRSSRTGRQDGAAGRSGRKRGGGQSRVIAADRSGGAARTNKKRDSNRREPPDSEKAHGEAARHLQKANAQVLNTLFGHREGCNIIRTAAVSKITESNFSIFLHSDHSFQAHSRTRPWSFPFPELCPEAERVSVSANLRRHRAAFDLRFSILCTISHKILFYDVFTGFSRHAPTHVYGAARIHGAAPQ
ncbi:hypothetical protein [uncultured Alistipes sp.]|uniref:hypothetical protein n=1 Tax=uncultured Alistipes sp. TaxID=538949 RepID=UPI002593773D|nr:hypothetical protein [uncultured Alistipes sp.]